MSRWLPRRLPLYLSGVAIVVALEYVVGVHHLGARSAYLAGLGAVIGFAALILAPLLISEQREAAEPRPLPAVYPLRDDGAAIVNERYVVIDTFPKLAPYNANTTFVADWRERDELVPVAH